MKNRIILALSLAFFGVQAQNEDIFSNHWANDTISRFGLQGSANFQPQSLNFSFASKFAFGGEINDKLKIKNLNTHGASNTLEANMFTQIFYQSKNYSVGKYDLSYGLTFESDNSAYVKYPIDFYQLVFFGNSYIESADLSQSKATIWDVQKIGTPITMQFSDSTLSHITEFGIQPTLYLGKNYLQFETNQFVMNTAEDGRFITFNGQFNATISDTAGGSYSGVGGGINAHIYQKINKLELRVSARNIGVINWQNSLNANFNQNRTYDGINVDDIFNLTDTVSAQGFIEDSLINWTKGNNTKWLPATFEISARYQIKPKEFIIGAIRYVNTQGFIPQTEVGYKYEGEKLQYGVSAGYGGMTYQMLGGYIGTTIYGINTQLYSHGILGGIAYNTNGLASNIGLRLQYAY
jgi:hypothetical protein